MGLELNDIGDIMGLYQDTLPEERWRNVNGYDNYYISSLGRVLSTNKNNKTIKSRLINDKGYYYVVFSKKSKKHRFTIHRLVAEAFIPRIDGKNVVNHMDENKLNNSLSNLEWCTNEYNLSYGTAIERSRKSKINHPSLSVKISQYEIDGRYIATYDSIREVCRDNNSFSYSSILAAVSSKNKECKCANGYYWKIYDGNTKDLPYHTDNLRKTVKCCDINGNLICIYRSILDANKNTGIPRAKISKCANGKISNINGYKFSYLDYGRK